MSVGSRMYARMHDSLAVYLRTYVETQQNNIWAENKEGTSPAEREEEKKKEEKILQRWRSLRILWESESESKAQIQHLALRYKKNILCYLIS